MDKKIIKANSKLLQDLIKIYIPQDKILSFSNYIERILSSKISSHPVPETEVLKSLLRKRVSDKLCKRVLALYSKLENNQYIHKASEIIFLLLKLSNDKPNFLPGNPISTAKQISNTPPALQDSNGVSEPKPSPENLLIRDIIFAFQGIEGKYLNFSALDDRFTIRQDIPDSLKSQVESLSEIGWLYKRITRFLSNNEDFPSIICQSFCASLKTELKEYYRLIALLETQVNTKLKKIDLWCDEPLERLKWLAVLCETIEGLKGGNLISSVFSYSKHGNPGGIVLINRIFDTISIPFVKMIENWMIEGELSDVYHEFFVEENLNIGEEKLWTHKYHLIKELIPAFFPVELVDQIFLTGKSINFIRKCCLEEWKSETPIELPKLRDLSAMRKWIEVSASLTNQKLIGILFKKYRLIDHATCIRKYLLLAQGDFHHYLMDQLNSVLNVSAKKIHIHNLVSILENAIRASNAQNDDVELLNKLIIKLEESTSLDIGWDVFVLKYHVDSPLNTVFSESVMNAYSKIFKLFWRIKRVYFYMNSYRNEREMIQLQNMKDVRHILHKSQMLRLEILHFINNLCHYLMVEVQEGAWNSFTKSLNDVQDLDKLIGSHQAFLETISERAFLNAENEKIYKRLLKILELGLRFRYSQDTLISSALDELQNRNRLKIKGDMSQKLSRISTESIADIEQISISFAEEIHNFRKLLSDTEKTHLRFLAFRLDFNEFYSNGLLV